MGEKILRHASKSTYHSKVIFENIQELYFTNSKHILYSSHSYYIVQFTLLDYIMYSKNMSLAAIDWHPASNFIVTCSHDRNAFVWNYDEGAARRGGQRLDFEPA